MSRKPVHLAMAGRHPGGRQALWEAMRRLRRWTMTDLAAETRQDRNTVRTYMRALERGGYIEVCDQQPAPSAPGLPPNKAHVYALMRDVGIEAPRLKDDGTPCTHGLGREQMWRTLRILGEATPRDIALAASTEAHPVTEVHAARYLTHLHQAGYLLLLTPGSRTRAARYRLIAARNTGPRAPQVQRLQSVWDANLRKIMWQEEPVE